MATDFELEVAFTSRFKNTRLFIKDGRAFFGLWEPPPVELDGDEDEVEVRLGEEGQLELFALRFYRDKTLWYVIAQANHIDFPFEQVVPGMRLVIPKPGRVRAALLRALSRQQRRAEEANQ